MSLGAALRGFRSELTYRSASEGRDASRSVLGARRPVSPHHSATHLLGFKDLQRGNQPAEHAQSRVKYAVPEQIGVIRPAACVVVANRPVECPPLCLLMGGPLLYHLG